MEQPRFLYATPTPSFVATFVAGRYDMAGVPRCTFLRRGFNDCYDLRDEDGQRFVFRLSGWRLRGKADVGAETGFIAHLERSDVPVAAPVPTRSGALFTTMDLPQGSRPAVLFRFADGRPPRGDFGDARLQGATLARIHAAAVGYPDREALYGTDLHHLLEAPLDAVLALEVATDEVRRGLRDAAQMLTKAVTSIDLARTRCHGDCHGGNARIATEGAWAGQAVFFDFDDGGPGYLAYDLAVFLWAQMSFGRRRPALWHAFVEGYRSVRPITDADYEATHAFVAIRHIWLMGQWASKTGEWGSEVITLAWLEKELAFLQSWLRDRLTPELFGR